MPTKGVPDLERDTKFVAWVKDMDEAPPRWHRIASKSDLKFEVGCGYAKSWNHERLQQLDAAIKAGYGIVGDRYMVSTADPVLVARKSRWKDRAEVRSLMVRPCTNL